MRKFTTLLTAAAGTIIILTAGVLLSCGEGSKDVGPVSPGFETPAEESIYAVYGWVKSTKFPYPPVSGAHICFWDTSNWPNPPEYLGEAISREDGYYCFSVPDGEKRLWHPFNYTCRAEGYYSTAGASQYYPGYYRLDINLEPNLFPPPGEGQEP